MTLDEIKRWRAESTAAEASMTFISRVDRLIEIAEAAQKTADAWQTYCDKYPKVRGDFFENHRACYDLAETLKG